MKTKTLGKVAISLLIPVVGMGYLLQNKIKSSLILKYY